MENQLEVINNLTPAQKKEFEKDLQALYLLCQNAPGFSTAARNEVTVNMNLMNEVYLNVTIAFAIGEANKVKGKILDLYQYKDKREYEEAVAKENSPLN